MVSVSFIRLVVYCTLLNVQEATVKEFNPLTNMVVLQGSENSCRKLFQTRQLEVTMHSYVGRVIKLLKLFKLAYLTARVLN